MKLTKKVEDNAVFHVCDKNCQSCAGTTCGFVQAMCDKLAAYEDAEEQGLLVRLPCKVGDTLFFAQVGREEPFSMRVQGMSISASGNDVILHFGGFPITNAWGSEVGKTLFLTREEAETALKGEKEDDE